MKFTINSIYLIYFLFCPFAIGVEEKGAAQKAVVSTADDWRKAIDKIKPGASLDDLLLTLPSKSTISSMLWKYDGIRMSDIKEYKVWALDEKFAVIAPFGIDSSQKPDKVNLNKMILLSTPLLVTYKKLASDSKAVDVSCLGIP